MRLAVNQNVRRVQLVILRARGWSRSFSRYGDRAEEPELVEAIRR